MRRSHTPPFDVQIIAVTETAGSALYGMLDVLKAAGTLWGQLTRTASDNPLFSVSVVAPDAKPFKCGNGVPVAPDFSIGQAPVPDILILPELWLSPDDPLQGRYPALMDWICKQYRQGSAIYSACSGAVMLAATGLLDGREATSHWGYQQLFRTHYPKVHFRPEPNLVFADPAGRIVTAGGTTSWHDLALHLIARYGSPGEAMRIAKVYLLKWHGEGQLPYRPLITPAPHTDAAIKACERWLSQNYREADVVRNAVAYSKLPERTLKRRFKAATGDSLIGYVQNLRIEEAKKRLEEGDEPVEVIGHEVGYEDTSFFRRLFRRRTGLSPRQYRRLFRPIADLEGPPLVSG